MFELRRESDCCCNTSQKLKGLLCGFTKLSQNVVVEVKLVQELTEKISLYEVETFLVFYLKIGKTV